VDGEAFASANPAKSFEEVLMVVEPALRVRSRIVTAVRCNGVDEPAFRESDVRIRTLDETDEIDVATATPADIARAALVDASRLIPSMSGAAAQLSLQLRAADAPRVASELGPLAEGLGLLVALVQTAEDWARAGDVPHEPWLGTEVLSISDAVEAMHVAQQSEDWIGVADALRYDLCPALETWRERLVAEHAALPLTMYHETHGAEA
jgi:hypothetical protein